MARPSPRTVRLRTLLVDAMAATDLPLSTDELRELMPESVLPWRYDPTLYHSLRALERMLVCRRQYWPEVQRDVVDPRCVYWKYTQDEAFADVVAELDDCT